MVVSFDLGGLLIPSVPDTLGIVNSTSTVGPNAGSLAAEDGRSSRWQSHRTQRRRALIKAARKAVHALGYSASMEDIAAAAGTSKSVFYRYFGDKAGLQLAVGEVVIGQMRDKLFEAARTAQSPRESLGAMVSAYLQMAQTSPNVYIFVTRTGTADALTEPTDPGSSAELAHFFQQITAMMEESMRTYLAQQETPPALVLAAPLWPLAAIGMVRAAGERWISMPDGHTKPSQLQLTEQLTTWLFDGLSP